MSDNAPKNERRDYDNLYKTAVRRFFWDGLKFFMPDLYSDADTSGAPEFLDKELQKVTFDIGGGSSEMDLLASVKLKRGGEEFVLCHLEVQGEGGGDLPLRMYRYKEAIHLLYNKEPAGIAVITAKRPGGEKTAYSSDVYGVKVSYEYRNYFVPDIPDEEFLSGENRIGLILYAAKCAYESGGDEGKKFSYLRQISGMWDERGWNRDDKRIILEAVGYLIRLSDMEHKKQYAEHVKNLKTIKGDSEMYQSVFAEVTREEGREIGKQEKAFEIAKNLLARGISPDIIAESSGLSIAELKTLSVN